MAKRDLIMLTVDPGTALGRRKLFKYLRKGYEVVSQSRRGALCWKPGQVDYLLRRKGI